MKFLLQNILILAVSFAFAAADFAAAQTKPAVKAQKSPAPKTATPKTSKPNEPTPDAKKSSAAKTAKVPAARPDAKKPATDKRPARPAQTPETQIIVKVTSARVRQEPSLQAATLRNADIGTIFTVLENAAGWTRIKLPGRESGWISRTIIEDFKGADREKIYRRIADKYLPRNLDFASAAQLFAFLTRAEKEVNSADLSFKRLLALRLALGAIPFENIGDNPFKGFTENHKKEIVYSEPSGRWYVRSELFWELHGENKQLEMGEEIAWQAAKNPLPGECEGYVNCYLYLLRVTDGEYLNFYPGGKHSRQALKNITDLLEPLAADAPVKQIYNAATDISDRADFNRLLTELRSIISNLSYVEKQKALRQIDQIAEGYR